MVENDYDICELVINYVVNGQLINYEIVLNLRWAYCHCHGVSPAMSWVTMLASPLLEISEVGIMSAKTM